jgi:hypothetical protein
MQTTFEDPNVARQRDDRLRFKKGKLDRICIVDSTVYYKWVHFLGTYVECTGMEFVDGLDNDGKQVKIPRLVKPCKFHEVDTKDPAERFGAKCIIYTTDNDAIPIDPLRFSLKWWPINKNNYAALRGFRKAFGDLRARDLIIQCTNEDYQHLQISPANEAWWLMNEQFKQDVVHRLQQFTVDIDKELALAIPLDRQDDYIKRWRENDRDRGSGRGGGGGGRGDRNERRDGPPDILRAGGGMPSFAGQALNGVGNNYVPPAGLPTPPNFGTNTAPPPATTMPPVTPSPTLAPPPASPATAPTSITTPPAAPASTATVTMTPVVKQVEPPPNPTPTPTVSAAPSSVDLDAMLAQLKT